jgi:FtsP/CotA-like multicopper oxidase with cupredoxin domain
MGRNQRIGLLLAALVIVVVAAILIGSGGGDSSDKTASGPQTVTVVNGKAEGGIKKITYKKGDTVDLTVKSDTADEIHIHGYDLHKDVTKGGSVHFTFPASLDGTFVIELENAGQQIASLQVEP